MDTNEDYLDSLLKAATENIDPNSAINKVSALSNQNTNDTLDEEPKEGILQSEESNISDQDLDDLLSNLLNSDSNEVTENLTASSANETTPQEIATSEAVNDESLLEDTRMEESPVEEPQVEESPAEESPVEEPPVEESPVEEPQVEESPVEEPQVEESPIEEPQVEESPVEESPVEELQTEEPPVEENQIEEPIMEETKPAEESASSDIDALFANLDQMDGLTKAEDASFGVDTEELKNEKTDDIDDTLSLDSLFSDIDNERAADSEIENDAFKKTDTDDQGTTHTQTENSTQSMSQEEIEALISKANEVETPIEDKELEIDMNDMASMEKELGIFDKNEVVSDNSNDDKELDEINSLLQKMDSNETVASDDAEMMALLQEAVSKQEESDEAQAASKREQENSEEETKKTKKKLFGKNKDKKKANEESSTEKKEKKPNKLSKLVSFMTDTDESEDDNSDALLTETDVINNVQGFEDVPGENKEILKQMDEEEEDSKGKKKKKKKGKKGKKGEAKEGDEEDEETPAPKKKLKLKKEKKKEELPEFPEETKKLSKKNIRGIAILCASLFVAILLCVNVLPQIIIHAQARNAYYAGDYQTTYNTFFGEKLNESDQILFNRSAIIVKLQHKYNAYVIYGNMNMQVEALDQLIQAVDNYDNWLRVAVLCGADEQFNQVYADIINALTLKYGLDEEQAKEILALPTDLEYSLKLESIVNQTEYIDPNEPLPEPFVPEEGNTTEAGVEYSDILPEEEINN